MIDGKDAGGRFALVQHLFAPRAPTAPMHRHHDEDEFAYVLTGRIGAVLGDDEVVGNSSDRSGRSPNHPNRTPAALATRYRCDLDFEATGPIVAPHGLDLLFAR